MLGRRIDEPGDVAQRLEEDLELPFLVVVNHLCSHATAGCAGTCSHSCRGPRSLALCPGINPPVPVTGFRDRGSSRSIASLVLEFDALLRSRGDVGALTSLPSSADRAVPLDRAERDRYFDRHPLCSYVLRAAIVATLVVLFSDRSSLAQDGGITAALRGTVNDTSGAIIPGAQLTLTNSGTKAIQTFTTDERGAFAFAGLWPGRYVLKQSCPDSRPRNCRTSSSAPTTRVASKSRWKSARSKRKSW